MSTLRARLPFLWRSRPFSLEAHPRALRSGLQMPERPRRGQCLLLSRALYRVKRFDLGDVPAAERRAVLRNLLLAWNPFDSSDYRVVQLAGQALAFAWDAQQLSDWLSNCPQPTVAASWSILPEGLFRHPLQGQGLRLLPCLEGHEMQQWRDGMMQASRWWPQPPDASEQVAFLRALPSAEVESGPNPSEVPWLDRPWAEALSLEALASNWSRLEQLTVGASLVGLAALSGAQITELVGAYQARDAVSAELDRAKLAAGPVLSARDRALDQARELDGLSRQLSGVQPIEVMLHLSKLLPQRGALLKELELNGNKLRLGLELAADVQRSAVVKDLQAGGWFTAVTEVRESAGRNWVSFEMTLSGLLPPADAKPVASSGGKPS